VTRHLDSHLIDPPDLYGPSWPETCPGCDEEAADEATCPLCGWVLDPEEAAAVERDEAAERAREI
jgi:hypothetical protein